MPTPSRIRIDAGGTSLVLDSSEGRLPAVLHWGGTLGASDTDLAALALAALPTVHNTTTDSPSRVAVVPEAWTGWQGLPGLQGSRDGADWSPLFTVTAVEVDDAPAPGRDELHIEGPARLRYRAEDTAAALALDIEVEVTAQGLVRARATVVNRSAQRYDLIGLAVALPVPSVADELLDMAGRWTKERVPQRHRLGIERHVRENRTGHTGHNSATLLHLGTPGFGFASGEVWAVHTAWSGNHLHFAERLPTGGQVIGGGEVLLPGEVSLALDESYRTPWVYAAHGEGLDDVARRFHRFLRARPQHPRTPRPVTLNVWEAVYFDHDLPALVELAERAADLGVERYVLDDGWFGGRRNDHAGLGDWFVSPDVWPDGLSPLIDRVTALGMRFGLWVEPEMVNPDSDLARAHPEWIMATGHRLPLESRHQQVLNLGIPEAYAHVRDALVAVLDEYDIAYLKWDHNRTLVDAGTQPSGRAGVHEQTLAYYRLVDELKDRFPGLEIEACASGGGRIDLEVLERTDRVWVSDCIDPHERQAMHRWTGQLLPPELMGAHVASGASHTTGRFHDLSFRAATAVFGHFGIEWDLRRASAAELDELRAWIAFYREHRGLLHIGDLVRLDHPDADVVMHGVVAPDRSTAIYTHVSTGRGVQYDPGMIRFPGLDPDRRYEVTPAPLRGLPEHTAAPAWWGLRPTGRAYAHEAEAGARFEPARERIGIRMSGAALARMGLVSPQLAADHAVVYVVRAVDAG